MNSAHDESLERPATLMALIAHRAQRAPDAIALLAPGRPVLTFGGLLREVRRTVLSLAAAGLGRGNRVGLALPNGPEMALAILAVTDCATCAPLNPDSDEASCRFLLKRLRIDALIVEDGKDSAPLRAANALGLQIVKLAFSHDDPAGTFTLTSLGSRPAIVARPPVPDDVTLLLHTSGTTAESKPVPLKCRSLIESAITRACLLGMTSADRCLCVAPLFTSTGSRRNLFPTLGAGASVVCTPGLAADSFLGWLDEFRPTFYTGSPTIQRAVLDAVESSGAVLKHSLRFVISGSAPLPPEVRDRLENALGVPVIPAYATTEAGAITQCPLPPGRCPAGSVGLPAGSEVAVLADTGKLAPPHEVGEIVVRGPEVFEGYEDDPEANRQAILEDGCFRTGDLGYLDDAGYLFLTGRIKELINRGGFKVSPSEIDAVLMRHSQVLEAASCAVPHATLGEDVISAVVLREPSSVTAQQLRDYAFEHLAAFKVPSQVLAVPELPKTSLGKVKRGELAATLRQCLRPDFAPPREPYEEWVARLFAEVLGTVRIGAHDNFFDLGGDSLRGAQVVTRVNSALRLNLDAASLFRRPSVAEFAAELKAATGTGRKFGPPPIVPLRHAWNDPTTNDANSAE